MIRLPVYVLRVDKGFTVSELLWGKVFVLEIYEEPKKYGYMDRLCRYFLCILPV